MPPHAFPTLPRDLTTLDMSGSQIRFTLPPNADHVSEEQPPYRSEFLAQHVQNPGEVKLRTGETTCPICYVDMREHKERGPEGGPSTLPPCEVQPRPDRSLECQCASNVARGESKRAVPVRLPCAGGHTFCRECILTWLDREKRRTCPLCREELIRESYMDRLSSWDSLTGRSDGDTVEQGWNPHEFFAEPQRGTDDHANNIPTSLTLYRTARSDASRPASATQGLFSSEPTGQDVQASVIPTDHVAGARDAFTMFASNARRLARRYNQNLSAEAEVPAEQAESDRILLSLEDRARATSGRPSNSARSINIELPPYPTPLFHTHTSTTEFDPRQRSTQYATDGPNSLSNEPLSGSPNSEHELPSAATGLDPRQRSAHYAISVPHSLFNGPLFGSFHGGHELPGATTEVDPRQRRSTRYATDGPHSLFNESLFDSFYSERELPGSWSNIGTASADVPETGLRSSAGAMGPPPLPTQQIAGSVAGITGLFGRTVVPAVHAETSEHIARPPIPMPERTRSQRRFRGARHGRRVARVKRVGKSADM